MTFEQIAFEGIDQGAREAAAKLFEVFRNSVLSGDSKAEDRLSAGLQNLSVNRDRAIALVDKLPGGNDGS